MTPNATVSKSRATKNEETESTVCIYNLTFTKSHFMKSAIRELDTWSQYCFQHLMTLGCLLSCPFEPWNKGQFSDVSLPESPCTQLFEWFGSNGTSGGNVCVLLWKRLCHSPFEKNYFPSSSFSAEFTNLVSSRFNNTLRISRSLICTNNLQTASP